MATVTIRPNGVQTIGGAGWTIVGGSATHSAAQSDDSDSTYSKSATTAASSDYLALALDTFTLPALAQARQARTRMRLSTPTSGSNDYVRPELGNSAGGSYDGLTYFYPNGTISTFTGPWFALPSGLTQADIDAFGLYEGRSNGFPTEFRIYEAYVDVLYNEAPVATLTAPTEGSTVTSTSQPTVSWTYADPESDVQERYRVKVFTVAANDAFGAGTDMRLAAGAVYDSGEVLSAATSHTLATALANGSYVVYVFVADVGSGGRYSTAVKVASASTGASTYANTWTQTVVPPAAPTLVATPEPTTARVKLDVTAAAGSPTTEYFIVERSADGGTTWVYVRGGKTLTNPASGTTTQTVYDYEAPRDTSLLYRARSVDTGTGLPLVSTATQAGPVTLAMLTDGSCHSWLKSYTDPSLNISFVHADTRFESKSTENMAVYETEGRSDPIIHGGTIRSEAMTITFKFDTDAQWRAFEALRALKEPLLFQSVFGDDGLEEYWVRLGPDRSVIRMSSGRMNTTQDRLVSVAAREVRRPTVV